MKHTLAIVGVCALSLGCAQAPSSPAHPTAAAAKAFLDDANATTLKLGIRQGQGPAGSSRPSSPTTLWPGRV